MTKQNIQRLKEGLSILDAASSSAPLNRQAHINATVAIQEIAAHLDSLTPDPEPVADGN